MSSLSDDTLAPLLADNRHRQTFAAVSPRSKATLQHFWPTHCWLSCCQMGPHIIRCSYQTKLARNLLFPSCQHIFLHWMPLAANAVYLKKFTSTDASHVGSMASNWIAEATAPQVMTKPQSPQVQYNSNITHGNTTWTCMTFVSVVMLYLIGL